MTATELIERVQARGGDLRLDRERLQYRPAGVLSNPELAWLTAHRDAVARALAAATADAAHVQSGQAQFVRQPLGEAGPGTPAWHCPLDLRGNHILGKRADGSALCVTCHPLSLHLPSVQ